MTLLTDREIVEAASRELTPLKVEIELRPAARNSERRDLVIRGADGQRRFAVEVKRHITTATAAALHEEVRRVAGPDCVVLSQHITPRVAESLRDLGQQFIDASGNAYLRGPGLLIWQVGRRAETASMVSEPRVGAASIKIQFGLLAAPDLASEPLREIASATLTSLGSVQAATVNLQQRGHLAHRFGRKVLVNRARLLDDWLPLYLRVLRPRLVIGRYVGDSSWWMSTVLPPDAQWGGEVAAAKLTGFLRPELAIMYASEVPKTLLTAHRLRRQTTPEQGGVVEFRRRFWRQQAFVSHPADTVPAVLTYADLLAVGDGRAIEVAERIRGEHLAGVLAEP